MDESTKRLREALTKITEAASELHNIVLNASDDADAAPAPSTPQEALTCTPKMLPKRLLLQAAETAVKIHPVNAPAFGPMAQVARDFPLNPEHLAVLTSKYWGPTARRFTVSFMESTPADVRARILSHMNAWWYRGTNISFVETTSTGDIRISRSPDGYWSYLGTDVMLIPKNRATMNLESFTMSTPESEYKRVVRHETGHTLGFPHEHMRAELVQRIDPAKAYEWFWRTYRWDKQTVDQQVLTALDERSIMATPADQTSIMCYQLPGSITRDGKPILGGMDINVTDFSFAWRIYPRLAAGSQVAAASDEGDLQVAASGDEWDESEDVDVPV